MKIGVNADDIYHSLLLLGRMYDFDVGVTEFEKIEMIHNFLLEVYDGKYDMEIIMRNVSKSRVNIELSLFIINSILVDASLRENHQILHLAWSTD